MKPIVLFLFLLLYVAIPAKAEDDERLRPAMPVNKDVMMMGKQHPKESYKNTVYWKRHKRLRACGWTAFSVGIATTTVGLFGEGAAELYSGNGRSWRGVIYTGIGVTAASIPLFVFSRINRARAKRSVHFSLGGSSIQQISPNGTQMYPALGATITF